MLADKQTDLLAWGFLTLIFLVASIRTNVAFMIVFLGLTLGFGLLTGTQWQLAKGNMDYALKLLEGGGGCAFVSCCAGWWILISLVLISTDFPLEIPRKPARYRGESLVLTKGV